MPRICKLCAYAKLHSFLHTLKRDLGMVIASMRDRSRYKSDERL